MSGFTDEFENSLIDGITGVQAFTLPGRVYLALFTADPGEAGESLNELSGADYIRQDLLGKLTPAVLGVTKTNVIITYTTATALWPNITHAALCSGGVVGVADLIATKAVAFPVTIKLGETLNIDAGVLTFELD